MHNPTSRPTQKPSAWLMIASCFLGCALQTNQSSQKVDMERRTYHPYFRVEARLPRTSILSIRSAFGEITQGGSILAIPVLVDNSRLLPGTVNSLLDQHNIDPLALNYVTMTRYGVHKVAVILVPSKDNPLQIEAAPDQETRQLPASQTQPFAPRDESEGDIQVMQPPPSGQGAGNASMACITSERDYLPYPFWIQGEAAKQLAKGVQLWASYNPLISASRLQQDNRDVKTKIVPELLDRLERIAVASDPEISTTLALPSARLDSSVHGRRFPLDDERPKGDWMISVKRVTEELNVGIQPLPDEWRVLLAAINEARILTQVKGIVASGTRASLRQVTVPDSSATIKAIEIVFRTGDEHMVLSLFSSLNNEINSQASNTGFSPTGRIPEFNFRPHHAYDATDAISGPSATIVYQNGSREPWFREEEQGVRQVTPAVRLPPAGE